MAGLHIHFGEADAARLDAVADFLRFSDEASARVSDGAFHCVWLGHEQPDLHGPAHDPQTGVRVITSGRAVLRGGLPAAPAGAFEGGRVNQVLLARYLDGGPDALDGTDGALLLCVHDPRDQRVHLWTDAFGYHPAFLYRAEDPAQCVISTFPDAIAQDPKTQVSWDPVSMAEFLRAWRVTPPHTYYEQVKHAGAATCWTWSLGGGNVTKRTVWQPFEQDFYPTLSDAADHLAEAVGAAIQDRTGPEAEPVACFVSGGADSRVLLFAAQAPGRLVGINLYDEPTAESDVARRLCDAAGARYVGFQRDRDYYPRLLPDIVRWSGAMWCAEDSHYLGAREAVSAAGAHTVMTACTTDWLFKGYGLEKTHRKLFGRSLPLARLTKQRVDGFLPNVPSPAPAALADAVAQRMAAWFEGTPTVLTSDRDHLLVEDRRVRPACYAVSVSGPMMYRVFPYDTFLADGRIAACYERIRPQWKLDGRVWGLAATALCREARGVVDANHGWSVGASGPARVAAFARGWFTRRMKRLARRGAPAADGPATDSWPDFGWYVRNSATLEAFWRDVPAVHRERVTHALGRDPWAKPLANWAGDAPQFFRMATLLHHWALNDQHVHASPHHA